MEDKDWKETNTTSVMRMTISNSFICMFALPKGGNKENEIENIYESIIAEKLQILWKPQTDKFNP